MERHAIAVRGIVQGVGFRPFVHGLTRRHALCGFVSNDREGVAIEVEGARLAIERFERELLASPPPLARITEWSARPIPPRGDAASGSKAADPARSPPSSRRTRRPAANASTSCGIVPAAGIGIRSSRAPTAARASP
jgi:acylphosphatase